jgi:hypothetical protein
VGAAFDTRGHVRRMARLAPAEMQLAELAGVVRRRMTRRAAAA